MKKLLNIGFSALIVGLIFTSCNDDDDYETIESIDKVKIDSVKIVNDTMNIFDVQSIKTYSDYASQCEGFYGYDYIYNDNLTRTVTAYKFRTDGNCSQAIHTGENQINFNPQYTGTYTFKFWNGGTNWITKTIVVEQ
ncbi:hypothetical protein [Chryseobacterium populi]|uniref:Lipoprotein n=1 Tax=Chryseobacterium populi TaxID=1144316 RepID=J2K7V3_9FLAO|nr:hypothetical protein [Chryseobacterium populi]EJL69318.1 hypothetical protein PMI13_03285 [Chryseobacterium populi]